MFTIPNLPASPAQVFHLATPHHMLLKLAWEIGEFEKLLKEAPNGIWGAAHISYSAFNTAVTAWHCADWAWRAADVELKTVLAERFSFNLKNSDRKNLENFCDKVASNSRELHICRQIANGSKHMGAARADPDIAATVVWQFVEPGRPVTHLEVVDGGASQHVETIFRGAFDYWERLFGDLGYIEGRYVGPD
jgi:hypothetical protein